MTTPVPARLLRPAAAAPGFAANPLSDPSLEKDMVRRMAFMAMLGLLFVRASTMHEILFMLTGTPLYVLYVLTPPAAAGVVLSGGINRALWHRVTWLYIGFLLCIVMVVPFSTWVGGSALAVFHYFRDHVPLLFFITGTIYNWKEYRTVLNTMALSAAVLLPFALFLGGGEDGRLAMRGTIGNANDLAAHLLLLIPFLLLVTLRPGTKAIVRAGALGFATVALYAVFRTASRGALLALAVGIVVYLLRAPVRQRIIAALMIPVALGAALAFTPEAALQRLRSFSADGDAVEEAIQSSDSREYVLRKSIEYTLRYPLTGVGLGQFSTVEGGESRAEGQRGTWQVTHNTYTQVSSECGIPALLFLLAALATMFLTLGRIARRAVRFGHAEIALTANLMITSFVMFCTAATFLSLAYYFYFPALIGLTVALHAVSKKTFSSAFNTAPPPARPQRPYDQAHAASRIRRR